MVIRTGQTREPQTTLHTSNYCVAYLDILGGVNKIKADKDNKFLNLLNMLYVDVFNEAQGIFNEDKDIVVKIFSDNILLAMQIEKESPEKEKKIQRLLNVVSNIYNEALRYGYLLRGGISEGEFFINEIFVYGNALLDVYKMESKIAIYPRVLVSKEIYELLPHYCLPGEDGLPFLNNFLFFFTNECITHKLRLLEMLKENKNDLKVKQKIMWLINKFNEYNRAEKNLGRLDYQIIEQSEINKALVDDKSSEEAVKIGESSDV